MCVYWDPVNLTLPTLMFWNCRLLIYVFSVTTAIVRRSQQKAPDGAVLRIRDVYPGSWFLPIPDLGSRIQKQQTKERGEKNFLSYLFLQAQMSQNWILFYFWNAEEKNLSQFSRNYGSFYPKIVTKLPKMWVWDSGSEIRDPEKNLFRIPDPGVKKEPDPGSGSATLRWR